MHKMAMLAVMVGVCAAGQTAGVRWGGRMGDEATGMARDAAGNLYVVGTTSSTDLGAEGGGLSARTPKVVAWGDVFVQKMGADGTVVWRAVFGGSGVDRGKAVAVDAEGNVIVVGMTQSFDFPVTTNAYQPKPAHAANYLTSDGFVAKLAADGTRMVYATYIGGDELDEATAVGVDPLGQVVVAGDTFSDNIRTTGTSLKAKVCAGYGYDGWVAKLNAEGTGLMWGTYLCGSGHDHVKALVVDRQGAVYVAGETASADFPVTKGSAQEKIASTNYDGYVVKLAASGNSVEWGTYYGGVESEWVHAMTLKADGKVVLGGETRGPDLPKAAAGPAGMMDGFVAQVAGDGKSVEWARLLGGVGEDRVTAVSADAEGRVWLGGWTRSSGWHGDVAGGEDGFVGRLGSDGQGEEWVARVGGRLRDRVLAVKATGAGVAAAGGTEATEWLAGAPAGAGQWEAFVALPGAEGPAGVISEGRGQRPVGGVWSGAGRIEYQPKETVESGRRWMVELREAPAAGAAESWRGMRGATRETAMKSARDAVRASQMRMRQRVEGAGGRVYGSVDLIANVLFVEADAETAERLRAMEGVKRVMPVSRVEPELDTSLRLHLVAEAFTRIGGWDKAGAGVKIGIVDTGVEEKHEMLADPGLTPLEGYPRGNKAPDLEATTGKVIVARSYVPAGEKAHTRDDVGHGTGVASIAAGSPVETQLGLVSGVAPFAYIGNYKMMTNEASPYTGDDLLVTALEDAAADGMDVVNLSLHSTVHLLRPEDDILTDLFERLTALGTMVVKSTGNEGPEWSTLTAPHVGEWGLMVANHWNARITVSKLRLGNGSEVEMRPGGNTKMEGGTIEGGLVDVEEVAPGTWGCTALPAEKLTGKIAVIYRGSCNFSVKGENARKAGAVAMVVTALEAAPEPIVMGMATEMIPAFMVSAADGQSLRSKIKEGGEGLTGTVELNWTAKETSWEGVSSSSSSGPALWATGGIKPDLIATGTDVWEANAFGGYKLSSGTSMSAPHVTGAIAVVKGARPGLDARRYRSLIINTAEPLKDGNGKPLPVMKQGAGRLLVDAAVASTVTAYPTSLHMGTSRGTVDAQTPFRLENIGTEGRVCAVAVEGRTEAAPVVEPAQVEIGAGSEAWVVAKWKATGLAPGQYDGHIRVRCEGEAYALSIPYWHGVRGTKAENIKIASQQTAGTAGQTLSWGFTFRITDEAGLPLEGITPAVTVTEGTGSVDRALTTAYPGVYVVHPKLGSGTNRFRISYGGLTKDVTITGQ